MRPRSLTWYRTFAISGAFFGVLAIVIAVEVATHPGPWNTKIPGFAFVAVALALAFIRIREYLRARSRL
jgi:membrane protein implicated in regulation of membrane protease activity